MKKKVRKKKKWRCLQKTVDWQFQDTEENRRQKNTIPSQLNIALLQAVIIVFLNKPLNVDDVRTIFNDY